VVVAAEHLTNRIIAITPEPTSALDRHGAARR
jgi:hypothetical protein